MAVKDLDGKRSGRPRGVKTSSRVKRDILWAYRNLGNPDAKPPSPGAKMWAEHARQEPGHFLGCVVRMETAGEQETNNEVDDAGPGREPAANGDPILQVVGETEPQRLMTVFIPWAHLMMYLTGDRSPWVKNVPRDSHLVSGEAIPKRRGIQLTIRSETFLVVGEGEGIPELLPDFASNSR